MCARHEKSSALEVPRFDSGRHAFVHDDGAESSNWNTIISRKTMKGSARSGEGRVALNN